MTIPYARHSLDQADKDAVLRVLDSDRLTQGPEVDAFEREFAKAVDAPYAVAFSSGTAALHAACFAAGLQRRDKLVTSALTFVASANCGAYLGADPVFADINPKTLNVTAQTITEAAGTGVRAIVPVHFAGYPAPVYDIRRMTSAPIIEDACHALGARTEDGSVGNCAHSDFTCFSFHPSKAITTGEGGMVTCRTKANVKALKRFRNHGFSFPGDWGGTSPQVSKVHLGWYREQRELGFNYRMSDIHAALGRSQLPKLPQFIERRWEIAMRYFEELEGKVTLPPYHPHHAWHLFVIRHPARNAIYEALKKRGIQTQVHYVPLYRNSFHRPKKQLVGPDSIGLWPNTEAYFSECLSLPIFPSLSDSEQTEVIQAVKDVV